MLGATGRYAEPEAAATFTTRTGLATGIVTVASFARPGVRTDDLLRRLVEPIVPVSD